MITDTDEHLAQITRVIDRGGNLLPSQGPITAFVFLNTLQALEDIPFHDGLRKGTRLFGCSGYLPEDVYREKITHGRITVDDIVAVLNDDLGDHASAKIAGLVTRAELQQAMLQYPLRNGPVQELRWFIAETDALTRLRSDVPLATRERFLEECRHWVMRDLEIRREKTNGHHGPTSSKTESLPHATVSEETLNEIVRSFGEKSIENWKQDTWEAFSLQSLWRICREGAEQAGQIDDDPSVAVRHRDFLLAATGEDSDALVHPLLIRLCAAFTDQGFADWQLPYRNEGFYSAFRKVYGESAGPPDRWLGKLQDELDRIEQAGINPLASIHESLEILGVKDEELEEFLTATLLALRGWAGLLRQMEVRGDRVPLPVPSGTVVEYLAVRLILERLALEYLADREVEQFTSLSTLRETLRKTAKLAAAPTVEQQAFNIFQLAQLLGWSPARLYQLNQSQWQELISEVGHFSSYERRRALHLAFERHYRVKALNAIAVHTKRESGRVESPFFQAVFCIDTREESFRRHLEEVEPKVETFGAAGFFGVPIYYKGLGDANYATLCPIVVKPQHWVTEVTIVNLKQINNRRAKTRKVIGTASHQVHMSSRGIAKGAILTAGLGVLASIPLVTRVLFPRLTARIRKSVIKYVEPAWGTRLKLERLDPVPGPEGDHIGFTVDEMANFGERMLRDIGLTTGFAKLVFFMGHGSFCLNNPHKSCYDCGACSGGQGGANARALAMLLNDSRVRAILAGRGIHIPDTTRFLGGLHNTCADNITIFDTDLLPTSHESDYVKAIAVLDETCNRNAHERCRRFDSAPLNQSLQAARRHVEGRSEDLAQTRPEFGNASNAMCFVGRRHVVRGLYMDRRCFLHSYDPATDDADFNILGRILGAVVPVCSGINLQYYFSYVDSPGWGCGTKLPHNITSLLGVMDGAASDLRTGLPWQGVEIHEPVRLLTIIETTPEAMEKIMSRSQVVSNILRNGWMQLVLRDPKTGALSIFQNNNYVPFEPTQTELPQASSSINWYRGWREHLGFAQIVSSAN